jgi:hypothetical protein
MTELMHHPRHYYIKLPEGEWEEFVPDTGSLMYHILFDMPAGEVHQTKDYHYKWEME